MIINTSTIINNFKNKPLLRFLSSFLVIGIIIIIILIVYPNKPPFRGELKSQVTSTILIPKGNNYAVVRDTAKYSRTEKLLSFKITQYDKTIATITEQPTPETFTDIPEFAGKFFTHAGEYKSFDSINGAVHLLHPQKNIKDAAAMNAKGTLMFVNPQVNFSEDDWRKLFQSISIL